MEGNKTEEQTVDLRQECLEKVNAVLQEYNFSLVPTFQLVDVKPKEVAETQDDKGEDK